MKLQNLIHILIGILCIGLLPKVEAVVPPPDGGYPNFTTAEGTNALKNLSSGVANSALGWYSLFTNTSGSYNTGVGAGTLLFNNNGEENTAIGVAALLLNTDGLQNTAIGAVALLNNGIGIENTAIGDSALQNNTEGGGNTATGFQTLSSNIDGDLNTAYGDKALRFNTSGSNNTALGNSAGNGVTTADHVICIGAQGANVSNTTWIGNVYGATTQSVTTAPVIVSDTGQLGTVVSSERFKKDISTMEKASEVILSLRPVTFHYKTDAQGTPQFGLIAEEVAKVNPALVLPDKEGKPYTVRYDAVNAMLLNEFLKEHRKNEEQQKQINVLTAQLKEQAAQIQKVSAQLETSKPAPQVVSNP
jgi:hypothetical protein